MNSIYRSLLAAVCVPVMLNAQSAKVQTAWRQLNDYNTSKDVSSLMKAKEAIDLASNHENTKNDVKTWDYRTQVYYALFKNALEQEDKKARAANPAPKDMTPQKKKDYDSDMLTIAYGNVSTVDLEESNKAFEKLMSLDKNMEYIKTSPALAMLGMGIMNDVNGLAVGKYKAGKYLEAAEYFEGSYESTKMMGKKDTNTLSNALLCAQKAKDVAKIKEYNEKIIKEKIATAYNYQNLYEAQRELKDSAGALATLKAGREAFPNDVELLNRETDNFLKQGKDAEALANIDKALEKTPNSAVLHAAKARIYNKKANPEDASGKELDKPKNYDEMMGKAEASYKKATELDNKSIDYWFGLGALYNGWANHDLELCDNLVKQAAKMKECENKATEKYMKAITALEKVLELNPTDKALMKSLRNLYTRTEQADKAAKMQEAINKK